MAEHDDNLIMSSFALVNKVLASKIFHLLEENKLINNKLVPLELEELIAIPILDENTLRSMDWFDDDNIKVQVMQGKIKLEKLIPAKKLEQEVEAILTNLSISISDDLMKNLPVKWEILGDLALIPNDAMNNTYWQDLLLNLNLDEQRLIWDKIASSIGVIRLGRQNKIADNQMRTSQVSMLMGDSGVVQFRDNGVIFYLDVTKVMFSSGNITERHRIGDIEMENEIIVDAFAGIGYYTLPMLVRSKAKHVYACEINPDSITALEQGAKLNNVQDKLTILKGDNRKSMPKLGHIADRVHLGILPSSERIWHAAISCLKKQGGIIHIHMNVKEEEIETFTTNCLEKLVKISKEFGFMGIVSIPHVEKVKWYAPRIRHIVLDAYIQ